MHHHRMRAGRIQRTDRLFGALGQDQGSCREACRRWTIPPYHPCLVVEVVTVTTIECFVPWVIRQAVIRQAVIRQAVIRHVVTRQAVLQWVVLEREASPELPTGCYALVGSH